MSFQMPIWFRNVAFAATVRSDKVLKYLTVFVRNCDFHGGISF